MMNKVGKLRIGGCLLIAIGAGLSALADSPFVRPNQNLNPVNAVPSEGRIRLDQLQFTGLFSIGGQTTFSLYDEKNKVNLWLPENGVEEGFSVGSFDAESGELQIQFAGETRRISLNDNTIIQIKSAVSPVVATSGKKIVKKDAKTLKEEEEARFLVTDLLEIGMQERAKYREERAKRLQDIRARQTAKSRARSK